MTGRITRTARRLSAAGLAAALLAAGLPPAGSAPGVSFKHIAFGTPLDVTPRPNETVTEAVREFHATGKNAYVGNAEAAAAGKKLYENWCAGCHMPDGSGHMGPSLIDKERLYPRNATDVGLFETIYGGALGAMQPFQDRLTQDEILKLIVYIHSLRER